MPNVAMPATTPEVFTYLKRCAREKRTATYTEIAKAVGLKPNELDEQLNYISTQVCSKNGLPCLAALVVRANTGIPGPGWTPGQTANGQTGFALLWCSTVHQVFATDWSKVEIENPA